MASCITTSSGAPGHASLTACTSWPAVLSALQQRNHSFRQPGNASITCDPSLKLPARPSPRELMYPLHRSWRLEYLPASVLGKHQADRLELPLRPACAISALR